MKRVVVIGAGPIGLEAALAAAARGWEVTVVEKGEVGEGLRRWGPTRFFSPLAMNVSERARAALGAALPPEDALLTGPEMAERVLLPLSRTPLLAGRVHPRHRVLAVGRARMLRTDMPGHPLRAERSFRVLVATPTGERMLDAEVVLDASGVYGHPLPLGAGGLPAVGERAAEAAIVRDLGELHRRRAELSGKRILVVGHGHSAAHAVTFLDALSRESASTTVVWATRTANALPIVDVAGDPLPERHRVVAQANELAARPPASLRLERRAPVEAISAAGGVLEVTLTADRRVTVDRIVALTGYRPDLSFLSELALEISRVTEGAARLHRALSTVTDCLSVPCLGPEDLVSGEPGFALVGAKSYGRSRVFLLRTGLAQLEAVMAGL